MAGSPSFSRSCIWTLSESQPSKPPMRRFFFCYTFPMNFLKSHPDLGDRRFVLISLFICSFLIAFAFQGLRWKHFNMTDSLMWADQVGYFQSNDPREFDFLEAYGHPGGPIIEGAIVLRRVFGQPPEETILLFVVLANSLTIACVALVCYLLRENLLWSAAATGILALNRLYQYSSPPTALAAPLTVLLCLLSLYLYEKWDRRRLAPLAAWSVVAGILTATRADIGGFCLLSFVVFLCPRLGFKKLVGMTLGAFLVFCVADPFIWFMPFQHVADILYKAFYHYAVYQSGRLPLGLLGLISCIAVAGIFLAAASLTLGEKADRPLPSRFLVTLFGMTIVLFVIFSTSHFSNARYYLPILFIWETLTPLFVLSALKNRGLQVASVIFFYAIHLVFFFQAFWFPHSFN